MRRWVKVSVTAAVVLGIGGWVATPYVNDWWLLRTACDGALPVDAVRELGRNGSHFKDATSASHPELGDYGCSLDFEGDELLNDRLLMMEAYTRRDDVDRELMTVFPETGFDTMAPMPDGMPGFIDKFGDLQFLVPCPALEKDDGGVAAPTSATKDAVFTMLPPPARSIAGIAYLQPKKTPFRFTRMTRSQVSSSVSRTEPSAAGKMPALLKRTSSLPQLFSAAETIAPASRATETSAWTKRA